MALLEAKTLSKELPKNRQVVEGSLYLFESWSSRWPTWSKRVLAKPTCFYYDSCMYSNDGWRAYFYSMA